MLKATRCHEASRVHAQQDPVILSLFGLASQKQVSAFKGTAEKGLAIPTLELKKFEFGTRGLFKSAFSRG
jgi:hypothetical protein